MFSRNSMLLVGSSITALIAFFAGEINARPEFPSRLPNGANVPGFLRLGHVTEQLGNNALSPFGVDFRNAGFQWTVALCQLDSDKDGFTNGFELGDPNCLWSVANPTPLRTTGLSHPGRASSIPATTGAPSRPQTRSPTTKAPSSKVPTTSSPTGTSSPVPPTAPTPPSQRPTSSSPTFVPSSSPSTSLPSSTPTTAPTQNPQSPSEPGDGDVGGFSGAYAFDLWKAHAIIMSLAFGLFLPIGVIIPAVTGLRKRKDNLWFHLHRACQIIFLLMAWIGFLIALFAVAMSNQSLNVVLNTSQSVHGPLGIALIVIVSVQALMGVFRPHLTELKSVQRRIFEFIHPWMGRSIVVLAAVQMYLGLRLLETNWIQNSETRNSIVVWAYFQAITIPIIVCLVVLYFKCWNNHAFSNIGTKMMTDDGAAQPGKPQAAHAGASESSVVGGGGGASSTPSPTLQEQQTDTSGMYHSTASHGALPHRNNYEGEVVLV